MTTTARDKKIADLVAALAAKKTRTAGQQAILDIHATSVQSRIRKSLMFSSIMS